MEAHGRAALAALVALAATGCTGLGSPRATLPKPKANETKIKPPELSPFPAPAATPVTSSFSKPGGQKKTPPIAKPDYGGPVREVGDDALPPPSPLAQIDVRPPSVQPASVQPVSMQPASVQPVSMHQASATKTVFDEAAVQRLGERLVAGLPAGTPNFNFSTIRNPRPQILRVGDASIIVSTGMLAELTREDDLAKLLAERVAEALVEARAASRPAGERQPAKPEIAKETGNLLVRAGFEKPTSPADSRPPATGMAAN